MNILPKTRGEWFDVFPFALKAWAIVAFPAAIISVRWMTIVSNPPYKELLRPVVMSYSLVCVLLFGVGVVHVRKKSKQAFWDFFFAVLALVFGMQLLGISAEYVK